MSFKVVAKSAVEIVAEFGPYDSLESAKADAQELADKMAEREDVNVLVLDPAAQEEFGVSGPVPALGPQEIVVEEGGFSRAPLLNSSILVGSRPDKVRAALRPVPSEEGTIYTLDGLDEAVDGMMQATTPQRLRQVYDHHQEMAPKKWTHLNEKDWREYDRSGKLWMKRHSEFADPTKWARQARMAQALAYRAKLKAEELGDLLLANKFTLDMQRFEGAYRKLSDIRPIGNPEGLGPRRPTLSKGGTGRMGDERWSVWDRGNYAQFPWHVYGPARAERLAREFQKKLQMGVPWDEAYNAIPLQNRREPGDWPSDATLDEGTAILDRIDALLEAYPDKSHYNYHAAQDQWHWAADNVASGKIDSARQRYEKVRDLLEGRNRNPHPRFNNRRPNPADWEVYPVLLGLKVPVYTDRGSPLGSVLIGKTTGGEVHAFDTDGYGVRAWSPEEWKFDPNRSKIEADWSRGSPRFNPEFEPFTVHKMVKTYGIVLGDDRYAGRKVMAGFKTKKAANQAVAALSDARWDHKEGRKREYHTQGRYGYTAVDVFEPGEPYSPIRTAISGLTKKVANDFAITLRSANAGYYSGPLRNPEQWLQEADEEIEDSGTEGAFTKQARRAGYKNTMQFARAVMKGWRSGKKTVLNKKTRKQQGITKKTMSRANFAINAQKRRRNPRRLVDTLRDSMGEPAVKIYRDSEWDQFIVVRLSSRGKPVTGSEYYADDLEDAKATARQMSLVATP